MKRQETCWCWLCFGITLCHRRGSISTDGPKGRSILLALLGLRQLLRARNPPGSPIPPPMPVPHHPVNRERFPGASPGCGKRKFPAMRHLLTPSVEVFLLVAAPRVGCGVLLSHMLLGQPHRDLHTALGCQGTCEQPRHGGRHPTAEQGTCGPCALQLPCLDGQQEPLPASRVRAPHQGVSALFKTGPTTQLDSLRLLHPSSPSLWAFPLEMKA